MTDPGAANDIVLVCCRDESDIIGDFIDFYLAQGFDRICIVDNGSTDGTAEQIMAHPAAARVLLLRDPRPGYDMRLLEYYRMFADASTRWVFFVDADEFVVVPGGIKAYAAALPADVTVLRLPTAEMRPLFGDAGDLSPLAATHREASFQREDKVVWKAVAVEKIYCGKHDVVLAPYVAHRDEQLYIRHYHTRSERQFRSKLRNRIQTEEAMGAQADALTLFGSDARRAWIERSRALLQNGGWQQERARLAELATVEDRSVATWFDGAARRARVEYSPVIPLHSCHAGWYCCCARDFRPAEGHTGDEHLVVFFAPHWSGTSLDEPVFAGEDEALVRLHSECVLGDTFDTTRCDCTDQLDSSMERIEAAGRGALVYLRQEGRGVGLFDKIRSLAVHNDDTFRRNEMLGLPADAREYRLAADVLRRLGIRAARLISGNPAKARALCAAGIRTELDARLCVTDMTPDAMREIDAKLRRGYAYELVGDRAAARRTSDDLAS